MQAVKRSNSGQRIAAAVRELGVVARKPRTTDGRPVTDADKSN